MNTDPSFLCLMGVLLFGAIAMSISLWRPSGSFRQRWLWPVVAVLSLVCQAVCVGTLITRLGV